jgi:predicted thioesterase
MANTFNEDELAEMHRAWTEPYHHSDPERLKLKWLMDKHMGALLEMAGRGLANQGLEEAARAIITHATYRRIDGDYMGKVDAVVIGAEDLRQLEIALRAMAKPDLGLYADREAVVEEDEKSL